MASIRTNSSTMRSLRRIVAIALCFVDGIEGFAVVGSHPTVALPLGSSTDTGIVPGCPFLKTQRSIHTSSQVESAKSALVSKCPYLQRTQLNAATANDISDTTWETLAVHQLEDWYREALARKCPFLRRRSTDVLDVMDSMLRQVVDESTMGIPLAYRLEGGENKWLGLSAQELAEAIRKDWRQDVGGRGYYVTGKLTTSVYRNDCLFDGPDPDMPIRGLPKYLNVASQLFDPAKSRCQLLSLQVLDDENGTIEARWRMKARMRLPWKPWLPVVTGRTLYHTDSSGLIARHMEEWDISVMQAFVRTLLPKLGELIWKE